MVIKVLNNCPQKARKTTLWKVKPIFGFLALICESIHKSIKVTKPFNALTPAVGLALSDKYLTIFIKYAINTCRNLQRKVIKVDGTITLKKPCPKICKALHEPQNLKTTQISQKGIRNHNRVQTIQNGIIHSIKGLKKYQSVSKGIQVLL